MKKALLPLLLIFSLCLSPMNISCTAKGDPTGPAIFIAAVILLGATVGDWFSNDHNNNDSFPPKKYDMLGRFNSMEFNGSVLSPSDRDWYRTEPLHPGEIFTVWSQSNTGMRAVLIDEYGRSYPANNYQNGSDFKIQIQSQEYMSYYLMVYNHDGVSTANYTLHWEYGN
jgi:hypothetical protein